MRRLGLAVWREKNRTSRTHTRHTLSHLHLEHDGATLAHENWFVGKGQDRAPDSLHTRGRGAPRRAKLMIVESSPGN
jgi:hypothetical protein